MKPDEYVKNILIRPTDRDKQRKVGASNLSNACTRCLADDMLSNYRAQGVYNMGAIVGTAIHEYLENFNQDESAQKEMRVVLGEIPGYGLVKSTTDLYLPDQKMVVDFKTTDRRKFALYQKIAEYEEAPGELEPENLHTAYATLQQYYRQAQLYAWGVEQLGYGVEQIGIVFVCRDGQIVDRDIWSPRVQVYSEAVAQSVFDRAKRLWGYLEDGGDTETLGQSPNCYYCNNVRPFVT